MPVPLTHEVSSPLILQDGQRFTSLEQLASALPGLSTAVFEYHVQGARHDFYSWIQEAFQHPVFAREVLMCGSKKALQHCFEHWLQQPAQARGDDLRFLQELSGGLGMLPAPEPPQPTIFNRPNQSPAPPQQPSPRPRIAKTIEKVPQAVEKVFPDKPLKAQRIQPKTMQELVKKLKEVYDK